MNEEFITQEQKIIRYFSHAHEYAGFYHSNSPDGQFFNTRLQRVYELLGDFHQKKILDVGCGPGFTAEHIIQHESEFFGIDISKDMIAECRRTFGHIPAVYLSVSKMEDLPFPDNFIDILLCLGALEYSDHVSDTIRGFSRVMKENGTLIVTMLNNLSPYWLWYFHIYRSHLLDPVRKVLRHQIAEEPSLHLIPKDRLLKMLAENHLLATELVYYNFNLWLTPLDRIFSIPAVITTRKLEFLYQSPVKAWGTGYIVKAFKNSHD